MLSRIAGYVINVTVDPGFVRHQEVKRLRGSREKLRRAVGELPVTPLDDTLRWMLEAMRRAPRAGDAHD